MSPVQKFLEAFRRICIRASVLVALFTAFSAVVPAQDARAIYAQIKTFALNGGKSDVNNLVLKRDRVEMTLSGTFYFPSPTEGRLTGAVFIGRGNFRATVPGDEFERANVKRLIGVDDVIESDFKTAVFRFSDDTGELVGANRSEGVLPPEAQELASEIDGRILKETGANLSSRIATSILNKEAPGFFFASFDGGKRGRFSYLLDHQNRIPTDNFSINAGEKGLIFKYDTTILGNEIWTAFHALADYQRGTASFADANDIVDVNKYVMDIDVTDPRKRLSLTARISMQPRLASVRAISFNIGEDLGEYEEQRLKKQMRVKSVKEKGADIGFVQEEWEAGFTVFLPSAATAGQALELELAVEGDFLQQPDITGHQNNSYPRSNSTWYPRHGYLDRSVFELNFRHNKNRKVASVGVRKSEAASATEKDVFVTKYEVSHPVALVTFAVGPFKRHADTVKWDKGGTPIPLEFNSVEDVAIKEDFILAELNNSVRYFHQLFGDYPYGTYSATVHPYAFGQGFPSMLMIPPTDRASKYTYAFVSHETAHQWWGNVVSWRSYRDQWLSEGFAEYSGVLYTNLRKDYGAGKSLIDDMRQSLKEPPMTLTGPGKGRLVDVGPLILGHRLSSRKTLQAYQTLVYNKGALALRMIHFLFTDPVTGESEPFFNMMKDFVGRYRNKTASTDDFRRVANEHFAKTPLAAKYGVPNLDWFFRQWVYQSDLPSYELEYQVEPQADGSVMLIGNVLQTGVGPDWFMPLPLVISFGGDKVAQGTVAAYGPKNPFKLKLPGKPQKVELDPRRWVLSEKTSTK